MDRLGMLTFAEMTVEQRAVAQAVIDGPRGAVYGPFVPLLRSPELIILGPSIHDLPRGVNAGRSNPVAASLKTPEHPSVLHSLPSPEKCSSH
jgi:hypothetical protein